MKNRLCCRTNNVLTVVFTTVNCYLLFSASKMIKISSKGKVQQLIYAGDNKNTHWLEKPLGRVGLLLKLLSLPSFRDMCVLSYSLLGLLSLHSLWWPSTETVVGFRVCTFLFRTRFMLPSSLRTKYWSFFFLGSYFPIHFQSALSSFEDQVPNFSNRGKTQSWISFLICLQL